MLLLFAKIPAPYVGVVKLYMLLILVVCINPPIGSFLNLPPRFKLPKLPVYVYPESACSNGEVLSPKFKLPILYAPSRLPLCSCDFLRVNGPFNMPGWILLRVL